MANNNAVTFTSREMEVLALAWQCMENQPTINMTKLASLTGYTPGSASVTLSKIKQKIKLLSDTAASNGPATPKKTGRGGGGGPGSRGKSVPTPSKRRASAVTATPSKRSRKGGVREQEHGDGDGDGDDEEDFGIKVKKENGVVEVKDEDEDEDEAGAYHGDAGSYGFLDGIEKFGRGG